MPSASGGAPVDTHAVVAVSGTLPALPAITVADQSYPIVYATGEATAPIYGRRYLYPPDAVEVLYGAGCGPLVIDGQRPYLGNASYFVRGHSGPANVPAFLLVGLTPMALPLEVGQALGQPVALGAQRLGCRRHVVRQPPLPIGPLPRVPRVRWNLCHGGPSWSKSSAARKPTACRAFRKPECRAL